MRMAWLTRRLPPLSQPVPSVLAGGGGDRGGAVEAGEAGLCWGWRRMLPTSPMMLAAPRWLIPTSPVSPVPIASSCCLISRSSCFSSMLSGGSVRFGAGASRAREARSRREQPFGPPAGYFRSYDLRHTCATLLLYEGRTLNEVAEHLGHSDPGFTARTYAHVMRDASRRRRIPITEAIRRARRGELPRRTPWADPSRSEPAHCRAARVRRNPGDQEQPMRISTRTSFITEERTSEEQASAWRARAGMLAWKSAASATQ